MSQKSFFPSPQRSLCALLLLITFAMPSPSFGYDKEDFKNDSMRTQSDPNLCHDLSEQFYPLLQASWVKAHTGSQEHFQSHEIGKSSEMPSLSDAPAITILQSHKLHDLSFPPYLQRTCHVRLKTTSHPPEDGYVAFVYYLHDGQITNFYLRWDSQDTIEKDFRLFQKRVSDDNTHVSPVIRQCRQRYPKTSFEGPSSRISEAAFDVRTRLILRCVRDQRALSEMFSDTFFIHR